MDKKIGGVAMKKITGILLCLVMVLGMFSAFPQEAKAVESKDFFTGLDTTPREDRVPVVFWTTHNKNAVRYADKAELNSGIILQGGFTYDDVENVSEIDFHEMSKEVTGIYLGDGKMYDPGQDIFIDKYDINSVTGAINIYPVINMTRQSDQRYIPGDYIDDDLTLAPNDLVRTRVYDIDGIIWNVDNLETIDGYFDMPIYTEKERSLVFRNEEVQTYDGSIYMPETTERVNSWQRDDQYAAGYGYANEVRDILIKHNYAVSYLGDDEGGSLFYLEENKNSDWAGYWTYSSNEYGAYFYPNEGKFFHRREPTRLSSYGSITTGFFPLNKDRYDALYAGVEGGNASPNHHFGTETTIDFYLPAAAGNDDCKMINPVTGELCDINWFFSGDDDLAVFVDGHELLDLSGIHSTTSAEINFTKGEAKWIGPYSGNYNEFTWSNNFYLSPGYHRLSIYYLERGGNESNLSMAFMLPQVPRMEKRVFKGHGTHTFSEDLEDDVYIDDVQSGDPIHYSIELKKDNIATDGIWMLDYLEDVSYDPSEVTVRTSSGKDITNYCNIYNNEYGTLVVKSNTDLSEVTGITLQEFTDIIVEIDGTAYPDDERPTRDIVNQANAYQDGNQYENILISNETRISPMIKGDLIVKHQLEDGTDLKDPVTTTEKVGTDYTTSPETFEFYQLKETPENKDGKYKQEPTEVVYIYEPAPVTLTVHYVDEDGNKLTDDITSTSPYGSEYTTDKKSFTNYEFVKTEGDETEGTLSKAETDVTYVYRLKDGTLVERHVTEDGEELTPSVTTTEKIGTDYETKEKTFTGYRLKEAPDNASGKYIDGTTTVTYVYEKIPVDLIVHYVDEDGNKLTDDVTSTHKWGDEYSTEEKSFVNYEFKKIEGDEKEGTLEKETTEVTYVYGLKDAKLVVRHVDEDGNDLTEKESYTEKIGTPYETKEKTFTGYVLKEAPENAKGEYVDSETTVTYVYKKIPVSLVVHYVDEDGNPLADDVEKDALYGDPYETEQKTFEKYDFVKTEGDDVKGNLTKEKTEVTYVYKLKDSTLTVKHVTVEGKDLKDPVTTTEKVGTKYETEKESFDGYELVSTPENKNGEYTVDPTTVTYIYAPKDALVNVIHVDEEDNPLVPGESVSGKVFDPYTTQPKDIPGYEVKVIPENKDGKMEEEPILVKYVYAKKDADLVVRHVDEDGKPITEEETSKGKVFDPYETEAKEFSDYVLKVTPDNAKGELSEGTTTVTYVYSKKPAKVIVRYVDKEGNPLTDEITMDGKVSDPYKTDEKAFDGYKIIEIPDNAEGKMVEEDTIVVYVYDKEAPADPEPAETEKEVTEPEKETIEPVKEPEKEVVEKETPKEEVSEPTKEDSKKEPVTKAKKPETEKQKVTKEVKETTRKVRKIPQTDDSTPLALAFGLILLASVAVGRRVKNSNK